MQGAFFDWGVCCWGVPCGPRISLLLLALAHRQRCCGVTASFANAGYLFVSNFVIALQITISYLVFMTAKEFIALALSFPGTEDAPHFDRTAFKVTNKRIFASLHEPTASANVKLSPADQKVFCKFDKKIIYPIDNKFGLQGWTTIELKSAPPELVREALETAYNEVFKKPASKK